jgi:hypothetical protein
MLVNRRIQCEVLVLAVFGSLSPDEWRLSPQRMSNDANIELQ